MATLAKIALYRQAKSGKNKKLDEPMVRWTMRENDKGTPTSTITKNIGSSARWV